MNLQLSDKVADRSTVEAAELNIENSGLDGNSFASSLQDRLQKITFVNARRAEYKTQFSRTHSSM